MIRKLSTLAIGTLSLLALAACSDDAKNQDDGAGATAASELIDDSLSAKTWIGETFVVDGLPHFTVSAEAGKGSLVQLKDGKLTTQIEFSAWLQVVKRIR